MVATPQKDNWKSALPCYSRFKPFREDDSSCLLMGGLRSSATESDVVDEQTRKVEEQTKYSVESAI